MPFVPVKQPQCGRCEKAVYPTEKIDCLDKVWHKGCFACVICKLKLTMSTYRGYEHELYCKTHYPQVEYHAVAETPESLRLKKQGERQSAVAYHEKFEAEKGKYTATADDVKTQSALKQQMISSKVGYQTAPGDVANPRKAATAQEDEEEAPRPAPVAVLPMPVKVKAPEPEPEVAPEPEAEAAPEADVTSGQKYKAIYDYDAQDADELSFKEDDIILNITVIDEGWMQGTREADGKTGMLPSNYVEPC